MSTTPASGEMPPLPTFAQPWGGALTATFIASIIYGITVLQTYIYYSTYPGDRKIWKMLVAVIFMLDTAALGLFMYCMHYYLVLSWGVPEMSAIDVKPFPAEYIITAVLVLIVQLFYINIVRALRAPIFVTLTLLALALAAFATGLILPEIQIRLHYIPVIVADRLNHDAFNAARASALACDLGVVASLCWLLRNRKSGALKSNNMINVFMMVALQRGVLQTLVQAGEVIAYSVQPRDVYFLPFHVIVSRVYCTSLLATLNTREYAVSKSKATPSASYDTSSRTPPTEGIFTSVMFDPPFLTQQDLSLARRDAEPSADDVEAFAAHANSFETTTTPVVQQKKATGEVERPRRTRALTSTSGLVEAYELKDFNRPSNAT